MGCGGGMVGCSGGAVKCGGVVKADRCQPGPTTANNRPYD